MIELQFPTGYEEYSNVYAVMHNNVGRSVRYRDGYARFYYSNFYPNTKQHSRTFQGFLDFADTFNGFPRFKFKDKWVADLYDAFWWTHVNSYPDLSTEEKAERMKAYVKGGYDPARWLRGTVDVRKLYADRTERTYEYIPYLEQLEAGTMTVADIFANKRRKEEQHVKELFPEHSS